jgi:hypothetical protein
MSSPFMSTIRLLCSTCGESDAPRDSYVEYQHGEDLIAWGEAKGWKVERSEQRSMNGVPTPVRAFCPEHAENAPRPVFTIQPSTGIRRSSAAEEPRPLFRKASKTCANCGTSVPPRTDDERDMDGEPIVSGRQYYCTNPRKKVPGENYHAPLCYSCSISTAQYIGTEKRP